MTGHAIEKVPTSSEHRTQMELDWQRAQQALLEAESELAQEQAAVNAFRMQCRLKIGHLIDDYLELRAEKQALWTRLQLQQQAQELGIPYDEDDPFWHGREEAYEPTDEPGEGLLPNLDGVVRDRAAEKRLYRELARRFHPDLAATGVERAYMTSMMAAVNIAYQSHNLPALRDLADEMDPTALAELEALEDMGDLRRLREQILKVQRRQRRARQQLASLRRENTARLWHKAAALEADGRPWWEAVRADLMNLIARRQADINALKTAVSQWD